MMRSRSCLTRSASSRAFASASSRSLWSSTCLTASSSACLTRSSSAWRASSSSFILLSSASFFSSSRRFSRASSSRRSSSSFLSLKDKEAISYQYSIVETSVLSYFASSLYLILHCDYYISCDALLSCAK